MDNAASAVWLKEVDDSTDDSQGGSGDGDGAAGDPTDDSKEDTKGDPDESSKGTSKGEEKNGAPSTGDTDSMMLLAALLAAGAGSMIIAVRVRRTSK